MEGKQGLSTVVTTLIIILLVLVAIGIVWVVVQNVIKGSGGQIDINTKCVTTNLELASATCSAVADTCIVVINKQGGYELTGVKGVVADATSSSTATVNAGDVIVSKTVTIDVTGSLNTLVVGTTYTVRVSGYFLNDNSEEITCPQVAEIETIAVA